MFKKLFVTLALLIASASAWAGPFVSFEAEYENGESTSADTASFAVIPGYTFSSGVTLELKLEGAQTSGSNDNTTVSIEPRLAYAVPVGNAILGIRGSVGQNMADSGNYSFYTIEPSVAYNLTKNLQVETSLKYKEAFGNHRDEETQTETLYLGGSYKLTEKNEVTGKYYHRFDSTESNGVEVAYTVYF